MSAPDVTPFLPYRGDARILNVAAWALEHFEATDRANAHIHMSQVRYSPITMELAEALKDNGCTGQAIETVLADRGRYPLDRGRVADDPPYPGPVADDPV